jgi:pimeloyl-ACP methyl ester carboxylesterase
MGTFRFRGTEFTYHSQHSGPAVIFIHGFLENRLMWSRLMAGLPRAYRKITLDLPGHGTAPNLGYVHTMEDLAALVHSLVEHLKLKRFFVCGHSLGGYVALALAEQHPDKIKGLLLLNSTARADSLERQKNRDKAIEVVKRNYKSYIRLSIPMLFRPKNRRNLSSEVNKVKTEALHTSQQGIIATLEGMKLRPDREVLLHFAPYPILFVGGKHDPVIPLKDIEEQMKGHRVTPLLLENGHMSYLEDFEPLLAGVKKFLKQHA